MTSMLMLLVLTLLSGCTAFLLAYGLFHMALLSDRKLQKRINAFLRLQDKRNLSGRRFHALVQMRLYQQAVKQKLMSKRKTVRLETRLDRAGIPLKPEEFVLFQWIATFLGGGLLYLLSGHAALAVVGMPLGYALPDLWLRRRLRLRIEAFQDGLQDMITTIIGSLKAGFSFAQSLKTVVDEAESPIKEEVELVLKSMQYGRSIEDALHELKERMPSDDLDLMIQAILIQRQVGGNLAVVLESIVRTIRDRNAVQRQIRTLTAQGRLSGFVIGLLPVALALALYAIEPEYIGTLFAHRIGWMLLGAGAVSGTLGFVFIRKMTSIEV